MALSMTTAIGRVRELVAGVSGVVIAYAEGETGNYRLPEALNSFPCALVLKGETQSYVLTQGGHRHTYEVRILVLDGRAQLGDRAATVLTILDALFPLFVGNVALGERVNSCVIQRCTGLDGFAWAGAGADVVYTGHELVLLVSEQASASPAVGA